MKKIIKISVLMMFLFQNIQMKSQDFKEFDQIKELADLLSPEGDLAKEIKKFKDSTNVNFYFKVHIEEDTALLPYLVELYTDVRVEKVEPYVIFTLNLVPKTSWTDFAHYTLSYNIEVSPDLQPLYSKLSRTIELLNKLVSNIQAILQDIQTLRQNLADAIKEMKQGLEILKRMPEIIQASLEKATQNIIAESQKSEDSLNFLLKKDSMELRNVTSKINGFDLYEIKTGPPPSQEDIVLTEFNLKNLSSTEMDQMKTSQDLQLFFDLSDSLNVMEKLKNKITYILMNANSYDINSLSNNTVNLLDKIKELIANEENTDKIVEVIEDYLVNEMEKMYNLQTN